MTLLLEHFDGAFPGIWEVVQAPVQISPGTGNPAPCVQLVGGGLNQPWIRHRPLGGAWSTAAPIDIFVYARFVGNHGSAQIEILDLDSFAPGVDGSTAYVDVEVDAPTNSQVVTYWILTQNGWVNSMESSGIDQGWHDYAFGIRSDGTASWYRDGVERLSSAGVPIYPANLGLGLRSFFDLSAYYDEVFVRRP